MDIAFNRPLDYQTLHAFLQEQLPDTEFFLLYEGRNDWDDVPAGQAIIQYVVNSKQSGSFKLGLSVFTEHKKPLPFIERLAQALAQTFHCCALCDASRVVLKENKTYYSLLFENGQVYLVDDFDFEERGEVTKIVELNYELPTESKK
jgi:hypothetical protein